MLTVYKRELRSLYLGYRGYAFTAIFAILYSAVKMDYRYFNMYEITNIFREDGSIIYFNSEYRLTILPLAFALAVPVMTFSTFERERKDGAYSFLRSLPITSTSVLLGKYFSLLTVFIVPYVVLVVIDLVLGSFSGVAWLTVLLSHISYILICNTFLSISFLCAVVFKNKYIALGVGYGISLGYIGLYALSQLLPVGIWREMLLRLSITGTYTSVVLGSFDFTSLFLWLSVSAVCLWLSFTMAKKEMAE